MTDAQLTAAQAIARCLAGGFCWDDELPESLRGYGVPVFFRDIVPAVAPEEPS